MPHLRIGIFLNTIAIRFHPNGDDPTLHHAPPPQKEIWTVPGSIQFFNNNNKNNTSTTTKVIMLKIVRMIWDSSRNSKNNSNSSFRWLGNSCLCSDCGSASASVEGMRMRMRIMELQKHMRMGGYGAFGET